MRSVIVPNGCSTVWRLRIAAMSRATRLLSVPQTLFARTDEVIDEILGQVLGSQSALSAVRQAATNLGPLLAFFRASENPHAR
jgi:hypothetical protein